MAWVFAAVLILAYANGANDNFKGVATLFGSRTTNYRTALGWACLTTFAGSLAALFLAEGLIKTFSGKGLVPPELTTQSTFLAAVGLGAAATVLIATATGLPISTTHALTGALVGAGLTLSGTVNAARLGTVFVIPLAVSPLLSLVLTALIYPTLRWTRRKMGVERQMCLCVSPGRPQAVSLRTDGSAVLMSTGVSLTAGQLRDCEERYFGRLLGIDAQSILDHCHFLSAGLVGFARGLNDTPKIVALLVAAAGIGFSMPAAMICVGLAMALGGLLSARRVAATMSDRIVKMNHGQGFTANVITAFLVTVASRFGVPVSTTHISCGSLFGLGAVNGAARWRMIRTIVLAWVVTLPLAAVCAAAIAAVI